MAIQIMFDSANEVQSPTMVLANRNGKSIGAIIPKNLHYSESMNSYNEMSFDVYKIIDEVTCPHWSKIKDFKLVYCVEWDAYFEIYVETDESDETIKHIQGRSLAEAELSQIKVYDLEINTELDISRDDYKPTVIYSSDEEQSLMHKLLEKTPSFEIGHVDISIAKLQRTFTFNDKTVYDALQEVSEEVKCLFEFVSNKGENGKIQRVINIYDLSPFCGECGHRNVDGDICPEYSSNPTGHSSYNGRNIKSGYGEDTNIFVSKQNLTDEITYSSDVDSVKNCFKLTAGDDLMTATVRNCSPSKSGYLWHFTEDVISDMSDDLRDIISQYKNAYEQYNTQFEPGDIEYDVDHTGEWSKIRSEYNSVAERYKPDYIAPDQFVNYLDMMNLYYDTIDLELYLRSGMMPTITLDKIKAADHIVDFGSNFNLYLQTTEALNSLSKYTAENLIESFLKTIVDSAFQIKLTLDTFSTSVKRWVGDLKIVSCLDEEDEASKGITVNFGVSEQEYTKQKLEASLAKTKSETPDVIALFDTGEDSYSEAKFKGEIAKYGLTPLIRLRDAGQSCLNILIEMGVTGNKASSLWVQNLLNQNNNIYNELYMPYYNRVEWLNEEIKKREEEIEKVVGRFNSNGDLVSHGMMSYLEVLISNLQEKLDLEGYIYTNTDNKDTALELLKELVSFRREDTYKNDNFISDGLDNAQIFARALEFVQEAEKDIKSAAVPVHTISSTLKNLLVMPEFKSIVKNFKVGNWIRAEIDSAIYKLRLINYEIGFDDLDNIQVEFSDVQAIKDSAADIQSILNQASSLASNYSNIKILANNSKKSGDYVWEWVNDGLALTKMKIVDDANNQNIYWDENGFLCREYSPVLDAYEDKQLKIINKGLYLTDDNWRTTRAGIGNFIYYDPSDGEYKESYGVIADTLVGNLILSESVGIYNINNSVQINENGFVIISKHGSDVFRIKKDTEKQGDHRFIDLLWVDEDGDLNIRGNITATSLTLGDNVDLGLDVDLSDYYTKSEADIAINNKVSAATNGLLTSTELNTILNNKGYVSGSDLTNSLKNYATITWIGNNYINLSEKDTIAADVKDKVLKSVADEISEEINAAISQEGIAKVADVVVKGKQYGTYVFGNDVNTYYFSVNNDGKLEANNAVIYGTIYAKAGEFMGALKSGVRTVNNTQKFNFVANNTSSDYSIKLGYIGGSSNDGYSMVINNNGNITFGSSVKLSWDNNIDGKPTIPTKTSQLTNDSNYANANQIPTNMSDLNNDLGYILNKDLSNYALSSELNDLWSNIPTEDQITSITENVITTSTLVANNLSVGYAASAQALIGDLTADKITSGIIKSNPNASVYTTFNLGTGELQFLVDGYSIKVAAGATGVDGVERKGGLSLSEQYGASLYETRGFTFSCESLRFTDVLYLYNKYQDENIDDPYYSEINSNSIKTAELFCKNIFMQNNYGENVDIKDNLTQLSEAVGSILEQITKLENKLGVDHTHIYSYSITKEATCTERGEKVGMCACGNKIYEQIEALGHIDNNGDGYCDRCYSAIGNTENTIYVGETDVYVNAGETTYLKFNPSVSGTYEFTSLDTYEDDPKGYLCDSNKNILKEDDDNAGDRQFVISESLTAGNVYYFGVKYYTASKSGTIKVKLSLVSSSGGQSGGSSSESVQFYISTNVAEYGSVDAYVGSNLVLSGVSGSTERPFVAAVGSTVRLVANKATGHGFYGWSNQMTLEYLQLTNPEYSFTVSSTSPTKIRAMFT